jgi:hypothetical protein
MGESKALSGFGQIDDLPDEADTAEPPSFGVLDFDFGEEGNPSAVSEVLPFAREGYNPTQGDASASRAHEEATRIVRGDALSEVSRSQPPAAPEAATLAFDEGLLAPRGESAFPGALQTTPSESGVASRDGRVAAMRELYAQGDADAALALASAVATDLRTDGPSASGGESQELDLSDPFGGLIPVDHEPLADYVPGDGGTAIASVGRLSVPPLAAMTSQTGVPRLLKSAAEVAELPIDHRAGFLLAHIDGIQSMEEILDVCAMPEAEALELIEKLTSLGVIALE